MARYRSRSQRFASCALRLALRKFRVLIRPVGSSRCPERLRRGSIVDQHVPQPVNSVSLLTGELVPTGIHRQRDGRNDS